MQNPDGNHHNYHQHHHSDTEILAADRASYSGPLSGPLNKRPGKKSARFNVPETSNNSASDDYVEITLDVREDSVAVHSVKTAGGQEVEDPELALLAKGLEKKSSFGSSLVRNASSRIRQVSQELKRFASLTRRPQPAGRFDRNKSAAAHALQGLKFISKTDGAAAWAGVENRFKALTAETNGLLPRALFGECIGKYKSQPPSSSNSTFLVYTQKYCFQVCMWSLRSWLRGLGM